VNLTIVSSSAHFKTIKKFNFVIFVYPRIQIISQWDFTRL
jgi:hypothetical protein